MRKSKIVIGVFVAGLLTAGCGSDGSGSDDGGGDKGADSAAPADAGAAESGAEDLLAVPITEGRPEVVADNDALEEPGPAPGGDAEFGEKVAHKLRMDLLRRAKVNGETSAECPDGVTLEAGAVSTCTATYEGVEIEYDITIKDSYQEGDFVIQYDTVPRQDLLVAARVYHEFWERQGEDHGHDPTLTCDEIPEVEAVEPNADTGYRCQVWTGIGGDGGTHSNFSVTMGAWGPDFVPAGDS